ncbi:hypothetical protein [Chryseobacterium sp. CCH4-E10]|uniref:hypothetical protein n=1 Tax=Chryseobacterium sp. CCH4-E10 TaxID=1768758 RepID=UPI0008328602|nr:hypothetical protein [Chryseobacterium sp. CCH4-E10]
MATPLTTILSWFETGDVPTQEQFQQTFSAFRHKDVLIPFNDVKGLSDAFQNTVSTEAYDVFRENLQERLEKLAMIDATNLDPETKLLWKKALGIEFIATVDSSLEIQNGNVYAKDQINSFLNVIHDKVDGFGSVIEDIRETLASDDMNLDELQEIVTYIKQNREQIELLQEVIIGSTTDDKIDLVNDYPEWGALTLQNQFNDAVYVKIQDIEAAVDTGKVKHQEQIRANATITHNLNTYDLIVVAYDTVTMYTLPIKVRLANMNAVDIEFDSAPQNFIQITIKKL